jgi:hypothetical protein
MLEDIFNLGINSDEGWVILAAKVHLSQGKNVLQLLLQ